MHRNQNCSSTTREQQIRSRNKIKSLSHKQLNPISQRTNQPTPHAQVAMKNSTLIETWFHDYHPAKSAINILPYVPPHHDHSSVLQQDKRIRREEILKFQNRDLHRLLTCKTHKFWTLIFRDPTVLVFLETYLKYDPSVNFITFLLFSV